MEIREYATIYINGEWVESVGGHMVDVENPATETVIGRVRQGTVADVDRAVAAARAAFPKWASTPVPERAALLRQLRDILADRQGELAQTISLEIGTPIRISTRIQAALPVTTLGYYADLIEKYPFEEQVGNSRVVQEAAGVVGAISPWNYPLHQLVAKIAPAVAAGCTVVVKPSELAPLAIYQLFEAIAAVGFPPGVLNLVPGSGSVVGAAIAAHPDVDVISFTGSVGAGVKVTQAAAPNVSRVVLELGGKSANVILDDADLAKAVKVGVANAFLNAGQTCTAWTRMLVHESQYEEAKSLVHKALEGYIPGDPLDEGTRLGPVASRSQRDGIRRFITEAIAEGAELVTGGAEAPENMPVGYYMRPTVLGRVDRASTLAQEEVFGPVLALMTYRDEDDALEIANDSQYGLHGGVWSAAPERALAFARRMRTGAVDINGGQYNSEAPFGGYKKSGNGREMGRAGLEEFLETKAIQL
jgi:aldehyde dehydrogenase (NAD+)